ncbi:hypothetical protein ACLQ24_00430 [Micromonospora sp. DT4]|uniref:hypothetical protein n=1 Tax=Micromonospora sp. DT4 TaxID=3393438 RepID=UPI003CFA5411
MTDDTTHTAPSAPADPTPESAWRTAAVAALGRLLTDQLNRIGVTTGQRVLDLTGAADLAHLSQLVGPSGEIVTIDAANGAHLPHELASYDVVLAHRQPDQIDALGPITTLLRPNGWLILAAITPIPPVIYTAAPGATAVIDTVVRTINALIPSPAGPAATDDTIGLLLTLGMDQACVTTYAETSRGGGPSCTLYRERARHLRDQLTASTGLTTAQLDRFDRFMNDPDVLLRLQHSVALHARLASL